MSGRGRGWFYKQKYGGGGGGGGGRGGGRGGRGYGEGDRQDESHQENTDYQNGKTLLRDPFLLAQYRQVLQATTPQKAHTKPESRRALKCWVPQSVSQILRWNAVHAGEQFGGRTGRAETRNPSSGSARGSHLDLTATLKQIDNKGYKATFYAPFRGLSILARS